MTIISDFDISILIEEVLETVFAGFNFSKNNFDSLDQGPKKYEPPPVSVIVDVNKWDSYVFRTQPGAWRRIVMNLFGNALKYTPAGFIKVKLQVIPSSDKSDDSIELRLTVTDSGIGMSEDYINNRLFHSFAQENPLSQGTGLGLSIVKQLVELLGGDVEVRSEKGRGTKFIVSCPLKPSSLSPMVSALNPAQKIPTLCKRTTGKVVQFVGFDDDDEVAVKSLKNKNASKIGEKALKEMCKDWFGLDVWDSAISPTPDLIMATEAGARELRAQFSKTPTDAPLAPVVVLCRAAALAQSTTAITVPGLIFECIAQPCGPHKLANALTSCLDRQANRLMVQSMEGEDISLSRLSQLALKENASPTKSRTSHLSLPRPHVKSAISAPEIRSVHYSPVNSTNATFNALNCLAVDDNPINLRLLRSFVEKLGHRHVLAKNGLEALEAYKTSTLETTPPTISRVDVILMDINMPEMDGLESTRQIRAYERDNSLPPVTIIALTGVASSETQQEAHASGVNLFLIKPVRLAELDVVLKGVVTSEEGAKTKDNNKMGKTDDSAGHMGSEVEVEQEDSCYSSTTKAKAEAHTRSQSSV
jgi:CheY-like chemotaxis protein